MRVEAYTTAHLPPDVARAVAELQCRVWPKADRTPEALVQAYAERGATHTGSDELAPAHYVVQDGGRAIASAQTFGRIVGTPDGELEVLTLAAVCSDPDNRKQGLGASVARAAFARVDRGLFHLCLFQTTPEVQAFYEKIGARTVDNRFVDSTADDPEASPWWDPVVMIYPAGATWPEGTIDLRGPAW